MTSALRPHWGGKHLLKIALFWCFGLGSWLTVNGLWIELPVFANTLPEGWSISTYFSLSLQFANLFPLLLITLEHRSCLRDAKPLIIFVAFLFGIVATALLAHLWDATGSLFGASNHSVGLVSLVFVSGIVDTMSTLTFWSYTSQFPFIFTPALAVGEGLSGLLPSLVGIIQDPSGAQRFPVSTFFIIMTCFMALSAMSFLAIHCNGHRFGGRLYGSLWPCGRQGRAGSSHQASIGDSATLMAADVTHEAALPPPTKEYAQLNRPRPSVGSHALPMALLLATAFANNGVMVSIATYILLPYAHGSKLMFWANTLSTISEPIVNVLLLWPWARWKRYHLLAFLWGPMTLYLIVAAFLSPSPPAASSLFMGSVVVIMFVANRTLLSYTKSSSFVALKASMTAAAAAASPHSIDDEEEGLQEETPLRPAEKKAWIRLFSVAGCMVQSGSFIGSVLVFFCANVFHWLHQ